MFSTYDLIIEVLPKEDPPVLQPPIYIVPEDPLIIKQNNTKLKAKITKIDNRGKVTIKFDKNMNVIANYSSLDEKAMELRIVNQRGEVREVEFKWNCTGFKETGIINLQLDFASPDTITMDVSYI